MNLVFYGYTFKKQIKSISTYITGVIALFPVWLTVVLYLKGNSNEQSAEMITSFVAFITFPVSMIFMSFKISQIFRDEIENKTILSIQSKPISRKQMVFQAILNIVTWSVALAALNGLFPFLVLGFKYTSDFGTLITHGILVFLSAVLLLTMIGILGLWLSLSMSGKAFVGTMIGGFVVGFYVLFAVSQVISMLGSKTTRIRNLEDNQRIQISNSNTPGVVEIYKNGETDTAYTARATSIYEQMKDVDKASIYTVFAWIAPSSQWARMFAANGSTEEKNSPMGMLAQEQTITNVKITGDATTGYKITFDVENKQTPQTWFPYVFWIVIGGITIPLMIKSLQRKNIA